jgi:exonuclease VII small subunit
VREYFVRIPNRTAYLSKDRHAFVIMEDLTDFYTLFELIADPPPKAKVLLDGALLSEFLIAMHRGDGENGRYATTNHIRELYVVPMLRHVEAITAALLRARGILDGRLERYTEFEADIDDALGTIIRHQRKIDRFPLALMHGDLHSRNIMIHQARQDGLLRRDVDLTFKLIDLESLNQSGDAAHDAGQLLIDLNLLQVSTRRILTRQVVQKLEMVQHQIEDAYLDFATARGDTTFSLRLELARARALIRIAKGQTKRSEALQKQREFQRVLDELVEVVQLVESASMHLKRVAKTLEGE